jgi:outer membrane biosynthesis protein TonB
MFFCSRKKKSNVNFLFFYFFFIFLCFFFELEVLVDWWLVVTIDCVLSCFVMSTGAKGRLEEELGKLESLLRLLDDFEHNRQDQKLLMMLSQKLKVIVPELRKLSLDPSFKTPECAPLLVTLGQGIKRVQTALTSLRAQGLALPPVHSDSDKQLGAEQTQDNDQHRQQQEAVLQIQQQQQQQQAIQRQEYMRQQEQEEQREEQRKQQQQQEQQQKQQLERQKQQEKQKQEQPLQPSQLSQQQPQVRTDWSRESRRSVDEGERDVPTAQPSPRSLQLAEPKPLKGFLKKRGDKGLVKGYKVGLKREQTSFM